MIPVDLEHVYVWLSKGFLDMTISYALIQGSSKGLGRAIVHSLLRETRLDVVATTSGDASEARKSILGGEDGASLDGKRLITIGMDVRRETDIEKARAEVEDRFGQGLRLLVNVSGVVRRVIYFHTFKTAHINSAPRRKVDTQCEL